MRYLIAFLLLLPTSLAAQQGGIESLIATAIEFAVEEARQFPEEFASDKVIIDLPDAVAKFQAKGATARQDALLRRLQDRLGDVQSMPGDEALVCETARRCGVRDKAVFVRIDSVARFETQEVEIVLTYIFTEERPTGSSAHAYSQQRITLGRDQGEWTVTERERLIET